MGDDCGAPAAREHERNSEELEDPCGPEHARGVNALQVVLVVALVAPEVRRRLWRASLAVVTRW